MRILVLGGTAWLGRETARAAVAGGHDVVCVARGRSGEVADGARLVVADRDRDDALAPLAGERWDAVVDVARHPGHVRRAARDLIAEHYVYVSSVSAYAAAPRPGLDESAPLAAPITGDTMPSMADYAGAKVAAELHLKAVVGERCTIARVGLIGGPGDHTDRATYWPWRFGRDPVAPVLVPDVPDQATSVIDVRDLAGWLLHCAGERVRGVFNTQGHVVGLGEHLATARAVAGHRGEVVAAAPQWLVEQGVEPWSGARSLPLWLPEEEAGLTGVDARAAYAAGLAPRPLEQTLSDVLAWRRTRPGPLASGLTDDEQVDLLERLSADRS